MGSRKLLMAFFRKPTLEVAQKLLGKYLVVRQGKNVLAGKIVETEAYIGENDLACHASKGRTPRTEMLYRKAGTAYVYLVYGMYHCFNIVTEHKDFPSAVLIRAVEPAEGIAVMQKRRKQKALHHLAPLEIARARSGPLSLTGLASGPGKLCMALGITKRHNGRMVFGRELCIEDRGERVAQKDIVRAKRIGVDYARHCKHYLWRFYLKENHFVSKK